MKAFWDYVYQDKSTGDTSLNRMKSSSLFFSFKKEESNTI